MKQQARLTPAEMQAGIDRLKKRLEEVKQFNPLSVTAQYDIPHVEKLNASIDDALIRTFGSESLDYERYKDAANIDNGPHNYAFPVPLNQVHQTLARHKNSSVALLEQAVSSLEEQLLEGAVHTPALRLAEKTDPSRKVFLVHGHDEGMLQTVARFLEQTDFTPIILHEQASGGRTVIEKIEANGEVGFAVVLLTPDDEGCKKGATAQPRARQNVVLELGYFIGRLGRARVCALKVGHVEIPSDFLGVVYVEFDSGHWKQELAKELREAGFTVDWNKVM